MNPSQNLRAVEVIARCMADDWPRFRRELDRRRVPSKGVSVGRSSEHGDPTANAVVSASMWDDVEQEAASLTLEALGVMRQLEQRMHRMLHVDLTNEEKAKMRCSGEHDATCTENAAVPSKRGMCAAGYMQWYRAQEAAKVKS